MPAFLNVLLFPLSLIYKTTALIHWYARKLKRHYFPSLFIISVDNLSFGGSGKTSLVCHLASLLAERQMPFAIVSRGYKSSVKKGCRLVSHHDNAMTVGDEACMLKRLFPQCTIMIGPDRLSALQEISKSAIRIVILDDGFQSAHIGKDFSILLHTPQKPGFYYRNFRFMAHQTDISLIFHSDSSNFHPHPPSAPAYRFRHLGLRNGTGQALSIASAPIIAFSALGDNDRFFGDLNAYTVKAFHPFPDHHYFSAADIQNLKQSLRDTGACYCVCTLKDFVKLPRELRSEATFIYAENGIELNFDLYTRLLTTEKFRDYAATLY